MRLTKQYAYGLLASVSEESTIDVLFQLQDLIEIFNELNDYVYALDTKLEDFQKMREILTDNVDPMIINFLEVITEDGMLHRLDTITEDYRLLLVEDNLIFDVEVFSAKALGEQLKQKIEELVQSRWGKNSHIQYKVDNKLIGGIRLEVNGAVIDTTFRSRIDQIIREVQHGSKK